MSPTDDMTSESAEQSLLSNLSIAQPADEVAREGRKGQWRLIDYETPTRSGTMLFGAEDAAPGPLTIPLGAEGWHAIYLGLPQGMWFGPDIKCKLTGDEYWFPVTQDGCPGYDAMFEGFWKHADLTGQDLQIERGAGNSALGYIRLVKLTDEQVQALQADRQRQDTRRLIAVHDAEFWHWGHFSSRRDSPTREDVLAEIRGHLDVMRDTDFAIVMPQLGGQLRSEIPGLGEIEWSGEGVEVVPSIYRKCIDDGRRLLDWGVDWLREYLDYAHELGLKVWVGLRGCQITIPPVDELWTAGFAQSHPEYHCRDREGRPVAYLSWWFPQVRERIHRTIRELATYGADGVGLSLVRTGPLVLYEGAAVEAFRAQYGYDPRERDEADPGWAEFRAGQLTNYMQEIREVLDAAARCTGRERLEFVVETHGPAENNRLWGYDLKTWANRGLVDVIIAKDQVFVPGTLEYAGKSNDFRDPAVAVDYPFFLEAVRGTDCKLYHDLLPRMMPANEYRQRAARAYAHGFTGLAFWDGPGSRLQLGQWEVVRRLGHPEELERSTEPRCEPIVGLNGLRIDRYQHWWTM